MTKLSHLARSTKAGRSLRFVALRPLHNDNRSKPKRDAGRSLYQFTNEKAPRAQPAGPLQLEFPVKRQVRRS
jgi:hypothetical protein